MIHGFFLRSAPPVVRRSISGHPQGADVSLNRLVDTRHHQHFGERQRSLRIVLATVLSPYQTLRKHSFACKLHDWGSK